MQLIEKIFYYPWQGRGNNCNSYLYAGEKVVLIDPGHIRNESGANCLNMLAKAMSLDGFSMEDIDLILCTHGHPDHCEAVTVIKRHKQTYLAMHKDEEPHMEMLARFFLQMTGKKPELPHIDIYLQEGDLELGKEKKDIIRILKTPGHSPGSLSFYFPLEKALITGDAVFRGSIGRTDFPGGSTEALGKSVEKLSLLDVELLLPGHMQIIQGCEMVQRNFEMIKRIFFS